MFERPLASGEVSNFRIGVIRVFLMFLYNLSLQKASGITHAITGSFSGSKQQEIVVAKGKILEIIRVDPLSGKLYTLLTTEVFGIIRSLMPFRLTGGSKGLLSFHMVLLLPRLHCHWFGFRSNCGARIYSVKKCI